MNSRARPRLRVLATGFGPFPGITQNASASVVRALAGSGALPGIELFAEVLPVEWARARDAAREAIARTKPHAVLHFGVTKRAAGFEIETRACNMCGRSRISQDRTARQAARALRSAHPDATGRWTKLASAPLSVSGLRQSNRHRVQR